MGKERKGVLFHTRMRHACADVYSCIKCLNGKTIAVVLLHLKVRLDLAAHA